MVTKLTLPKALQIWAAVVVLLHAGLLILVLPGVEADDRWQFMGEVVVNILGFLALQTVLLIPVVKLLIGGAWRRAAQIAAHMLLLSHICVTLPFLLSQIILGSVTKLLLANQLPAVALELFSVGLFIAGWVLIQLWVLRQYQLKVVTKRLVLGLVIANLVLLLGPLLVVKWVYAL